MKIERSTAVEKSVRVQQLSGLFDVPITERSALSWDVELPLEERDWNIGLVVGPSGCGKSTIARELWPKHYVRTFKWSPKHSLLDDFPADMGIKEITMILSSVGFSSPPSWMRPYHVLSNGEQFRTMIARALCEYKDFAVVDEFTSVVDRTVAKIGSSAIAKAVRRRGSKFIAVTCHYDVEAWLDPDWIYDPSVGKFSWRVLRGRPPIDLTIFRVHHSEWQRFAPHHYLTAELHKGAACFVAYYEERPVAFHSYLPFVGKLKDERKAMRGHRSVCLPDFQGAGIAGAMITHLARMYVGLGYRVFRNTGHPAEIASAVRSADWRMIRAPSRNHPDNRHGARSHFAASRATDRLTASFEFRGKALSKSDAEKQLHQARPGEHA
jgi:GNAT superfamily N-acetyltransferase